MFRASAEYSDGGDDPLDRWSRRVIGDLALTYGARVTFPSDGPPYAPFVDWALKSGRFWQSPVGMLVHDRAGLMISIRGAMSFYTPVNIVNPMAASPCGPCSAPCKTACPVDALRGHSYDVASCKAHIQTTEGAECLTGGCLARRACPVSQTQGRLPAQSEFHMRAFLNS